MKDTSRRTTQQLATIWQSARWALVLTWGTNPGLLSGLILCNTIQSLIPLGLAIPARGLINQVAEILNSGTGSFVDLLPWLVWGVLVTFLEALSRLAMQYFTRRLQNELNLSITADVMSHAASLDLSQFEDPSFLDVLQRARQNPAQRFSEFVTQIQSTARNLVQSTSLVGLLVFIEPLVVLLLLPIAVPYFFYQWRLAKLRYGVAHARATQQRWVQYFVNLVTNYESMSEVKLLGLAPILNKRFAGVMQDFRNQDRSLHLRSFTIDGLFALLSITAAYVALSSAAFKSLTGTVTLGDIAIFGGAAIRLRWSVEQMISSMAAAMEQTLHIANLREFLTIEPTIPPAVGIRRTGSRGEVELRNVTFTYSGSREPALRDVSLHIRAGESVALVGENGAGKTTLVKLIARLYDPDCGEILFDGDNVRELSFDYLRHRISFVFQTFNRFEATAADNIAYGDWQRLLEDRQMVEAVARIAGVDTMIEAMPRGYDTQLGRIFGEMTLSGGQWQRIALARAFARDSSLVILDEPTSNLDARSEFRLFSRFRKIAKNRTTIVISHRFSTVSMADRILVMDKGRIIERGTHTELVARAGHYANLFKLHQLQMEHPLDHVSERRAD